MPLVLSTPSTDGTYAVLIILGPENIERMKEKDPFQLICSELPFKQRIGVIQVTYASDSELTQITQLARQGKTKEAIEMATSGFRYRPELGDHDMGPERLGSI